MTVSGGIHEVKVWPLRSLPKYLLLSLTTAADSELFPHKDAFAPPRIARTESRPSTAKSQAPPVPWIEVQPQRWARFCDVWPELAVDEVGVGDGVGEGAGGGGVDDGGGAPPPADIL